MSRRLLTFVVSLFMTTALAAPVAAQEWSGTGRVSGVVTDQKGKPVAGAKVRYHLPGMPEAGPPALTTDKKGRYRFMGLKGTTWSVEVEAEGFLPFVIPEPTMVYAAGINDTLRIQLVPVPEDVLRAEQRADLNQRLLRGDELRAAGDYQEAREEYEKALGEVEEFEQPIILAALADTYVHEGRMDLARETLSRSLAIAPDHAPSVIGMMVIDIDEGAADEAKQLLDRIPPDHDIDPTILMKLAESFYIDDDMDEAKSILDRVLAGHPDTVAAYYFRGLVEFNLGQVAEARADITHFLELAPEHEKAAEAKEVLEYLATLESE